MKRFNKIYKLVIAAALFLCCSNNLQSQVNGFVLNCPGGVQNAGTTFQVNLSFNWTISTTSATAVVNYNPALVNYDPSCQNVLPACMSITNNPGTGVLTIAISSLSACTNTNAISFNVCFRFNCPDTCTGVNKTANFSATLTDNLSTTQNASCSATGVTPNNTTLLHWFHSYNSLTAEITYKAYFNTPTCFRIKNPFFSAALAPGGCAGTITQAWGLNYTYTVSGTTITPTTTVFNPYAWDTLYYVVKLPCTGCNNTTHSSALTWKGDNCNVPNSIIKGPVTASFAIPVAPSPNPQAQLQMWSSASWFRTRLTNTGNTPLNLNLTNYWPLVHLTSVTQYTNQTIPPISNTIKYYDCSTVPSGPYPLVGNAVTNSSVPANTSKFDWVINNLLPGNYVDLYSFYNLTSSCAGAAGPGPYKDSAAVSYNCFAPPNPCINCGNATGQLNGTTVYAPQPIINCIGSTYISQCKSVGDTLDFCFEFSNIGTAALTSGVFNVPLPGWLQYVSGSSVYTGFSPNPVYVNASNVQWNLPTIPVGTGTYKICFKAVVNPGAVGGTNWLWTTVTGPNNFFQYVCYSTFNICAYAAIGVEKKVKGSLDGSFGTSGNGIAGSMADYEVTIRNTGTIPIDNLQVIDRFPSITPPDKFILANPTCPAFRGSQFDMVPGAAPVVASCTISSSNDPNVCTGWPGVCLSCGPPAIGNWSGGNKAYRFLFNPSVTIAPGGSQTFYFQLKIPNATAPGLHACNTAGFIAKTTAAYPGYTLNATESNNVCIEVKETDPPPPGGCCKDLLKKIKEQHSVNNDVLSVSLTLTAGPKKMKKVTVSLVQFEVKHPKDCDVCVKDPKLFGNIVPGNNNLPWTTAPANVPFTHLIAWQDSLGMDWSNGVPVNFTIPLPPRSPIACCCDTIYYCLRYTFTDTACVMCDTTICYKTYNGKDCKDNPNGGGNDNPVCTCQIKPVFNFESNGGQTGTKSVTCGDIINLFAGNIYTSVIPNFTCKDQNGNDCPGSSISVIIKKPDNTTQVLTGPTYNYTYTLSMPGTYEYTITAICGGKDCVCKFKVVIPQH